ncbi:hypothetical protein Tco_0420185, partial [Tanacetum coccineum]
IDVEVDVDVVV